MPEREFFAQVTPYEFAQEVLARRICLELKRDLRTDIVGNIKKNQRIVPNPIYLIIGM
ncbi:MAG: hypothetical protein H0X47_20935 [Nitrospirales bacterium]|nr:hypothetical protein [Nitrospirales bacterium]